MFKKGTNRAMQDHLQNHYEKFEAWAMGVEDYFEFLRGLSEAGRILSEQCVKENAPMKAFLMFMYYEALLLTLKDHNGAPFYSFRRYYLDNMRFIMEKTNEIGVQLEKGNFSG